MVQNLDEVMSKIKAIKEEMDVVEFRVMNTRTHMETVEESMKKISKEILEGFHAVSAKINHLESMLKEVEDKIENQKSK